MVSMLIDWLIDIFEFYGTATQIGHIAPIRRNELFLGVNQQPYVSNWQLPPKVFEPEPQRIGASSFKARRLHHSSTGTFFTAGFLSQNLIIWFFSISFLSSTDLQVVQWSHEQEDQGSYLNPGVSFENGKFSMNETKFVFVYSQIGFSTRHSKGESCYFSHSLYRNRNGRNCSSCLERLLAFNSNLCSPDRQDGVQSSHLASSLYLDQHDEVLVRVSHPWRLVNNSGLNVFGIHT